MATVGIIAGSGAAFFPQIADANMHAVVNAWGVVASGVAEWQQDGHKVLFLQRHGPAGDIPPHRVNYRANIQALYDLGVDWIVALNAVGGIRSPFAPGTLALPDQLIDYTWGREHTFYSGAPDVDAAKYIDFTKPYSEYLRQNILSAAAREGLEVLPQATYGATQGPRLETAAEIDRLERDGCDIVGMTGMPEAALAREKHLHYASCCFVVNWAAGRSAGSIHADIDAFLSQGIRQAAAVIGALLRGS